MFKIVSNCYKANKQIQSPTNTNREVKIIKNMLMPAKQLNKESEMVKNYYTTQEVAKILGISKQTLLRYEQRRIFPRPKRNPINKRREYSPEDLVKFKKILGR